MSRKNLFLGGVLIVLLAIVYVSQGPWRAWRENIAQPQNFLAVLKEAEIDRVEIKHPDQAVVLAKAGDKWKIGGTKSLFIKDSLALSLASALKEAASAAMEEASRNEENKKDLGTDQSGAEVKVFVGDNLLADFYVGMIGQDYASTYVSLAGQSETYLLKTNIHSLFYEKNWPDLAIFSADPEQISKIRCQYPDREFTVEKKDGSWQGVLPYRFPVNQEKIQPLVDLMAKMTAVQAPFEQSFAGTGLEKHLIIVQAAGENMDNTIMVGEEQDGLFYAKRGDSDNIYLIAKEDKEKLETSIRFLR